MAFVEIRDLTKSFHAHTVLKGVNLDIEKGKTTVILGQSGCGKSVLVKHIIGLLKPERGKVRVDGHDVTTCSEKEMTEVLKRFGMLFQFAALFDSLTVAENVGFALKEHTTMGVEEIEKIVAKKLAQVGLKGVEDLFPAELSGGMRKRVGLARALSMDPDIVIFDEPTSGLDPITSANIDELIRSVQKELGLTAIVITHDVASSYGIGDHIALLHEGRVVEQGTPKDIQHSPNPIVQQFIHRRVEGPIQIH
ncbi:MAG: ABC transporter ATP-binding protein [Nitrospirae bacterium]|nr:ABC transporter ATP-binding protein [Nitrospirota bacterium]